MADKNIGEHQFLWKIENFSVYTENSIYCFTSPVIGAKCLDDSKWKVLLEFGKDDSFIKMAFLRNRHDNGPTELHLKVKVCLIDLYGKQHCQKSTSCVLKRHRKYIFREFVKRGDIFERKDTFLPNDVLTLLVRARKSDCDSFSTTSVVCTKILVGRSTFLWKMRRLCRKASANKRVIPFKPSSVVRNDMELTGEYGNTIDEQKAPGEAHVLRLAIRPKDVPTVRIFMSAKIQALDSNLNTHTEIEAEHFFEANSEDTWHLPSFDISDRMKILLESDRLYLDCDFSISAGTLKDGEVRSIPLADEFNPDGKTLQQDMSYVYKNITNVTTDQQDMSSVYKRITNVTPDIQLNVSNRLQHLSAHKVILSARSLVFREALNNFEMEKERWFYLMGNDANILNIQNQVCVRHKHVSLFARSCKDYARISNTSHDVLAQMLRCMYTDKLNIKNKNNAMDLYLTGVRFDFRLLREKSEVYLIYKISLKSFDRMLKFARSAGAVRLKCECLNFISKNWDFVLASKRWNKLRADYEDLAQEILNIVKRERSNS